METKMSTLICEKLGEYNTYANMLDVDKFTNAVLESFNSALSWKHYVLLVPVDLDKYFSSDQHSAFQKKGFCQYGPEERFNNVFYATPTVVEKMVEILKEEDMVVDEVNDQRFETNIKVVTIYGVNQSNYNTDAAYSMESDE